MQIFRKVYNLFDSRLAFKLGVNLLGSLDNEKATIEKIPGSSVAAITTKLLM